MGTQTKNRTGKNLFLFGMMIFMISLIGGAECSGQSCAADVSATIAAVSAAPEIDWVSGPGTITLNGGTSKTIYVIFNASDVNGYADLTNPGVQLSKSGETTRVASSCSAIENSTLVSVFNCTVDMEYYDGVGVWNINASISDNSANYVENTTVNTTVNALDYFFGTPGVDNGAWSSAPAGATNLEGYMMYLLNGGNSNYNTLTITAYNVTGIVELDVIPAEAFSVNNATGASSGHISMIDSTAVNVTSIFTMPAPGENSSEEIFFYVDLPLTLSPDSYTSDASWLIELSAV